MTATCQLGAQHEAPAADCSCGIYAWHPHRPRPRRCSPSARAAVTSWPGSSPRGARSRCTAGGFRAQHARPVAFVVGASQGRPRIPPAGAPPRRPPPRAGPARRQPAATCSRALPWPTASGCARARSRTCSWERRQAQRALRRRRLRLQRAGVTGGGIGRRARRDARRAGPLSRLAYPRRVRAVRSTRPTTPASSTGLAYALFLPDAGARRRGGRAARGGIGQGEPSGRRAGPACAGHGGGGFDQRGHGASEGRMDGA